MYKIYKKKHGPYFYKNIRTKDGVKTIYLGKDRKGALKREVEIAKKFASMENEPHRYRVLRTRACRAKRATPRPRAGEPHPRPRAGEPPPRPIFKESLLKKVRAVSHGRKMPYWILVPAAAIVLFAFIFALQPAPQPTVIVVEIGPDIGTHGTYEIKQTAENNFDVEISSEPAAAEKTAPKIEIRRIESLPPTIESKIISYSGEQPERGQITTPVAAVKQELEFQEAVITLPKTGPVNTIVYCPSFDFDSFACPAWERTKTSFTDMEDYITFRVSKFSAYAGAIINITKADHLDSGREFIESIYADVKAKDGTWSKPIPAGDYVRVEFERNLTSRNDITIYVRANRTVLIDGKEVPYDVYLTKKRIDEIGGLGA